ncbi:hypothetical protein MMEU_3232 [Mycobacterium marinum str. Europe]|nr:hypothetical protein MMEU_3232 [Mycobacterium marinum str. Europe]
MSGMPRARQFQHAQQRLCARIASRAQLRDLLQYSYFR